MLGLLLLSGAAGARGLALDLPPEPARTVVLAYGAVAALGLLVLLVATAVRLLRRRRR